MYGKLSVLGYPWVVRSIRHVLCLGRWRSARLCRQARRR